MKRIMIILIVGLVLSGIILLSNKMMQLNELNAEVETLEKELKLLKLTDNNLNEEAEEYLQQKEVIAQSTFHFSDDHELYMKLTEWFEKHQLQIVKTRFIDETKTHVYQISLEVEGTFDQWHDLVDDFEDNDKKAYPTHINLSRADGLYRGAITFNFVKNPFNHE